MRRRTVDLWSPAIGAPGTVIAYGHWGRPVLVFPHENGGAEDFESWGMVDVVADLIDGGRVKLYCVDSYDGETWSIGAYRSRNALVDTVRTSRGSSIKSCRGFSTTVQDQRRSSQRAPAWVPITPPTLP